MKTAVGVVLSLSVLLSGCSSPQLDAQHTDQPNLKIPRWDDEKTSAARFEAPSVTTPAHIAVSPNGEWLAFAVPTPPGQAAAPSESLLLFNWKSRKSLKFDYPIASLQLLGPTFAPDGKRLAFVATPAPRYGWGEIWIANTSGEYVSRINGCERAYRDVDFSPDGTKLAYFRDLWTDASRPADTLPENRGALYFKPWGVFETNLSNGTEWQRTDIGWRVPFQLRYGRSNDELVVWAQIPLGKENGPKGPAWTPSGRNILNSLPNPAGYALSLAPAGILPAASPTEMPVPLPRKPAAHVDEKFVGLYDVAGDSFVWNIQYKNGAQQNPKRVEESRFLISNDQGAASTLFDTAVAGDVLYNTQQGVSFSDNKCTKAYWSDAPNGLSIVVIDDCAGQRTERFQLSEIDALSMKILPPWRFGDACQLSR